MLRSIARYVVYSAIQILISFILAMTQRTTWEVPSDIFDLIYSLSTALMVAVALEIVIFIVDFKVFLLYPTNMKALYFLIILIAVVLTLICASSKIDWLFQLHGKVFFSKALSIIHIWGSIIGLVWSIILMIKHYSLR